MFKVIEDLAQHTTADLKKAFEDIKSKDTPEAKKKFYSKAYYQQNKAKYKKYYNENKEQIKEYAKNYKKQKKKKKPRVNGFSIVHKPVIVSFGFKKTECQEEEEHKSLSQLLSPQQPTV
jgi:outer membrane protein OmpA-like peptidoglycan-associated protein